MSHRSEEHHIEARADLDTVWRLLTTAEGLASWFGTEASIDLRVGGGVEIGWGSDERIVGRITDIESSARLRVAYVLDGEELGAEEWLLIHDGGVTHVRLIHSMPDPAVDDWEGYYGDFRRGWRIFLTSLRHAAELGGASARSVVSAYVAAPAGRPATWEALATFVRSDEGLGSFGELISDPPHTLLLTEGTSTVVCDLEGDDGGLVCYLQVASHGEDRDDEEATRWRDGLLSQLVAAVPG